MNTEALVSEAVRSLFELSYDNIDSMSTATGLGKFILDKAVSWLSYRTQRLYFTPFQPSHAIVSLLDLCNVIPPEYIILLAALGLISLAYLSVLSVITTWRLFRKAVAYTRQQLRREHHSQPAVTDQVHHAQLLTPHVTASQIRAIQRQEQLRIAALQARSNNTTSTESLFSHVESTAFPSQAPSVRGRSRASESRETSNCPTPTRRVTRSISARTPRP